MNLITKIPASRLLKLKKFLKSIEMPEQQALIEKVPPVLLSLLLVTKTSYDAIDLLRTKRAKMMSGAFYRVGLFPKFAVKVGNYYNIEADSAYINKMRRRSPRRIHFPITVQVNQHMMIQERCDINRKLFNRREEEIRDLAWRLKLSSDCKHWNTGWRKVGNRNIPIFFDVNVRDLR